MQTSKTCQARALAGQGPTSPAKNLGEMFSLRRVTLQPW